MKATYNADDTFTIHAEAAEMEELVDMATVAWLDAIRNERKSAEQNKKDDSETWGRIAAKYHKILQVIKPANIRFEQATAVTDNQGL